MTSTELVEAAYEANPFSEVDQPRPRFFPDELRSQPSPAIHEAEQPWARCIPANPHRALAEIAKKVSSKQDLEAIQKLEDEIGFCGVDREKHCNPARLDQALWDLQQLDLPAEELVARTEALERERAAIPAWRMTLDKKEAALKEKLRPFALRIAVELPGRIAKAINSLEHAAGPDGTMAYWSLAQNSNPNVLLYPLRRLYDLAVSWVESLKANDAEAKESRIRAILFDAGVISPKVTVYRSQF